MVTWYVIDDPDMVDLIKILYKNSDKVVVKALKSAIKLQWNPFKKYFRHYITDKDTYLFLNKIMLTYLAFDKEKRKGLTLKEI